MCFFPYCLKSVIFPKISEKGSILLIIKKEKWEKQKWKIIKKLNNKRKQIITNQKKNVIKIKKKQKTFKTF